MLLDPVFFPLSFPPFPVYLYLPSGIRLVNRWGSRSVSLGLRRHRLTFPNPPIQWLRRLSEYLSHRPEAVDNNIHTSPRQLLRGDVLSIG